MKKSDQWETPQELFDELNNEFNFTIDLCATENNTKCERFCKDYLNYFLNCGHRGFMNPPYSNPRPFIKKAWEDSKHCLIVCLLKCDTSTKWWGIFWNYETHQPKLGVQIRFFPKRIKYDRPDKGNNSSGPTFSSCLIILDRRKMYG